MAISAFSSLSVAETPDALPVQIGVRSAPGAKQFVPGHFVNHARRQLVFVHQRDADAIRREIVHEIGRAVQRIDDPFERLSSTAAVTVPSSVMNPASGVSSRSRSTIIFSVCLSTYETRFCAPLNSTSANVKLFALFGDVGARFARQVACAEAYCSVIQHFIPYIVLNCPFWFVPAAIARSVPVLRLRVFFPLFRCMTQSTSVSAGVLSVL